MQTAPEEPFTYSTQPHAAQVKKKKYRDDEGPQNIMYDNRVIRGNTYAAKTITVSSIKAKEPGKTKSRRFRQNQFGTQRSITPPPVPGRSHCDVQTDEFLEEIKDKADEMNQETQTAPYMDQPQSPLFVRGKIGEDKKTQIEDGDLFDFDLEVQPILEVLVGKTLHLSMLELMQEEELEAIREQQEEYENIRNVQMAEVQRLEADIKRKAGEKKRRIEQEKKRLQDKRNLEESIAARAFSNQFLGELHESVFDALEAEGAFYDPVKREVEELFMKNLLSGLRNASSSHNAASEIALELLENAKKKAKQFQREAIKQREDYNEKERLAAEERKRQEEEEARLKAIADAEANKEADEE